MTTLIAVYNSEGCAGRCDARCYGAKGTDCICICGGKNHGVGMGRAVENVRQYTRERLAEIEARGGRVPDELRQAELGL